MAAGIADIKAQYDRLRVKYADRDRAMQDVLRVRQGRMDLVFPELFADEAPIDRAMVANMVDVAARDTAEVLAPLPTFNCASSTTVSDRARAFAEKRTRIANNYINHCRGQKQAYTATDRYVTYAMVGAWVEPDWDEKMPFIRFVDSQGLYVLRDRFYRIKAVFQTMWHGVDDLCAQYPMLDSHIRSRALGARDIEVVRYQDKDRDVLFMPSGSMDGLELQSLPNPVGKVCFVYGERPGLTDVPRGQFDDVIAVQVAKARFAALALEAAEKAVKAPIAIPNDMLEMAVGPDVALRSAFPEKIRRVPLDVPREAFTEQGILDNELRQGSRYPDARNGEVQGNIVTGRGVQALMSGFDTQIRTGQAVFAELWTRAVELCFEMDEALWPEVEKEIRGNENGTPYSIKYKPKRDIAGDYTVDVQYGLMAGLDPNRALVFGLQARGDKLISRDFLRRQMPFSLDAVEEEQRVDVEELRDSLRQGFAAYVSALPALVQTGQDPGELLHRAAVAVQERQKGRPIEEVLSEAFAPAPPPEADQSVDGSLPASGAPGEGPPGGGELPPGMNPTGQLRGVAPGQSAMGPGGMPDVAMLLAGLSNKGEPNLQAAVSRRLPI